jgi:hypothetical protein
MGAGASPLPSQPGRWVLTRTASRARTNAISPDESTNSRPLASMVMDLGPAASASLTNAQNRSVPVVSNSPARVMVVPVRSWRASRVRTSAWNGSASSQRTSCAPSQRGRKPSHNRPSTSIDRGAMKRDHGWCEGRRPSLAPARFGRPSAPGRVWLRPFLGAGPHHPPPGRRRVTEAGSRVGGDEFIGGCHRSLRVDERADRQAAWPPGRPRRQVERPRASYVGHVAEGRAGAVAGVEGRAPTRRAFQVSATSPPWNKRRRFRGDKGADARRIGTHELCRSRVDACPSTSQVVLGWGSRGVAGLADTSVSVSQGRRVGTHLRSGSQISVGAARRTAGSDAFVRRDDPTASAVPCSPTEISRRRV